MPKIDTVIEDEFIENNAETPVRIVQEERVHKTPARTRRAKDITELDHAQRALINEYKHEKTISVRIAPSYAKYFGNVMNVSINGVIIAVRCDGQTYELPETFAVEVLSRMQKMDAAELKAKHMADVHNNAERSPGEIEFVL